MNNKPKKKLIEVAIPLEAINSASAREKSIRHGHPSTLHLWWARRPLAACRAVLFTQLVDDPSEYVEELLADPKVRKQAEADLPLRAEAWENRKADAQGNLSNTPKPTLEDCAAEIERKRLFQIIEDLVKWENSTNEEVLERARAEIRRSCDGELPPIYDPFSGGGSIPLEAQRLGLPAYGSDLNPVAVTIGKAMIEIPATFKDQPPIHPGSRERNHYRNAEGLAEDITYYGDYIREKAWERIGHIYPQVDLPAEYGGGKATVIAWIWARSVPSPDPAFADMQVPITSSFLLSSKKGKEAWIQPVIDKAKKSIAYRVRTSGEKVDIEAAVGGTKSGRGANFKCLVSGAAINMAYVRKAAKAGQLGSVLLAVVAEGKGGRLYLSPDEFQIAAANAEKSVDRPTQLISADRRAFTPPDYGMATFGDLFTERQLVALNTFSDLVCEARSLIETDAMTAGLPSEPTGLNDGGNGAKAYAEAVSVYLAFAVSKIANLGSTLTSWMSDRGALRETFARQALPMVWDYAEVNFFSNSGGNWSTPINKIAMSVANFPGGKPGSVKQLSASEAPFDSSFVISTDPPYYDNIGYADLSDFFYCWLRRNIGTVYPDLFGVLATPKTEELIAAPYRHGGREAAEEFFLEGMTVAISKMAKTSSDFPATIYYAFKQSEVTKEGTSSQGWAAF
jgi:putative DNA methylase